jgi:hypothetical protein
MSKQLFFGIAAALLMSSGAASAQNEPSQDTINAPTGLQSTTPDKPPVATVPEAPRTLQVFLVKARQPAKLQMSQRKWVPKWIVLATSAAHLTKSNRRNSAS